MSMICKEDHNEASNEFLKWYSSSKLSTHIIYLDGNNLYGHSII